MMGCCPMFSSSVNDPASFVQPKAPNPDPWNFEVLSTQKIGNYTIAEVKYRGCTNYEGKKVLLYKTTTWMNCLSRKVLDPHFSGNSNLDPLARFEPTNNGWAMACALAVSMKKHF